MKKRHVFYLLVSLVICSCSPKINEEAIIKKLLEKESATWRAADAKGHADCWHIKPYSRILVSTAQGLTFDVSPAAMIDTSASNLGHGGVSVNSNYKMMIKRKSAWVSHNEESTDKEGKKTYSYEIRLLEKIKGQWKLTGQSIHIYKPK